MELRFPENTPVVLIGENNAGKSNVLRALHLVLGPFWPGSHEPEDNEFHGRDRNNPIEIQLAFGESAPLGRYTELRWLYSPTDQNQTVQFFGSPGQYGPFTGYVRNDDRDHCVCTLLEADRNLEYQLSYSSKWTMLSRLMHRFHRSLASDETTKRDLEALFERTKEAFSRVPEFAAFSGSLRTQLDGLVSSMTHRLEVSFEAYNPANFFHALRLQAVEGGVPRALEEMGTGEKQILAMAFAHAYAQAFHGGVLLAIEEPESHLHPLAQLWLARRLREMAADGLQVVLTTHNPTFVNLLDLSGIALLRKTDGETEIIQRSAHELVSHCQRTGASSASDATILSFYSAHATSSILEGFFAKTIVLVEGPTESLALPIYLGKVGLDCAKEGIAVIPVGGKGNLGKWHRLFTLYDIPVHLVFDNDSSDDRASRKRHDALAAMEVPRERWDSLLNATGITVESGFTVFGQNFEETMRSQFPSYAELEGQARRSGIDADSKPLVARWVAEGIDREASAPGWVKFQDLASVLRSLGTSSPDPDEPEAEEEIPF